MLDGVYLDGEKLPPSSLSSSTIELSALIDTVSFFFVALSQALINILFCRETPSCVVRQTSLSSYTLT